MSLVVGCQWRHFLHHLHDCLFRFVIQRARLRVVIGGPDVGCRDVADHRILKPHFIEGSSEQELARFGPVPLAADKCRDARGTGFIDDLTRDIPYAFRTFRRAPFAAPRACWCS